MHYLHLLSVTRSCLCTIDFTSLSSFRLWMCGQWAHFSGWFQQSVYTLLIAVHVVETLSSKMERWSHQENVLLFPGLLSIMVLVEHGHHWSYVRGMLPRRFMDIPKVWRALSLSNYNKHRRHSKLLIGIETQAVHSCWHGFSCMTRWTACMGWQESSALSLVCEKELTSAPGPCPLQLPDRPSGRRCWT